MGLALKFRTVKLEHFEQSMRREPWFAEFARKLTVIAPAEIDRRYPQLRPARVMVSTRRGRFTRQADEALGSRLLPLDDDRLTDKFLGLVGPVLGSERAAHLKNALWSVDQFDDVAPVIEATCKRS
jgi:2-methylcitrate dehydratase PrpD